MRSERGLSTILHCLQWYKLLLQTVQYPVQTTLGSHILHRRLLYDTRLQPKVVKRPYDQCQLSVV